MARTARASRGGICYHVLNRGNGRAKVFHNKEDYQAFVKTMADGCQEIPLRVLAYCLLPNHFHLVLWPYKDGDLSRWMRWLMTAHVRRYHQHYHSSGHVWQGRFKAFPIQQDEHLLLVLRYVEGNPLRARLVKRAEAWPWSSLAERVKGKGAQLVHAGPVGRPRPWLSLVHTPLTKAEMTSLRQSVNRETPFGAGPWVDRTARRLGLESTLRPRGRPPKEKIL